MTAAVTLAHAQALLRAIAKVHVDQILIAEERSAILTLLLGCTEDSTGDDTLNALEAIFADHDDTLSESIVERFAQLTNACHALGQASSFSRVNGAEPRVKLVGTDGNAFAVLGRCRDAANKARWSVEQWERFRAEATSGDYDHLLATVQKHFEVR